jgi:putative thioredoxin
MRPGQNSQTSRSSGPRGTNAGGGAGRRPAPSPQLTTAMAGAVDLAAIKARSEAAARAASAPPAAPGAAVISVTEAGFQADVLDRSYQVPVLIVVVAVGSPASDQLTPILEKLAGEGAGAWVLAVLDVDASPRVAQALQVQSVPTVFAVIAGQLVPGFSGALPEEQVREFIAAVLDAGAQSGLTGAAPVDADAEAEVVEPPSDPRFDAAEAALETGDFAAAVDMFQAILDAEPANADAALALRQTKFLQRLETTPADAVTQAAAAPTDVTLQLAAADQEVATNESSAALERLLGLISRVFGDDREQVRDRLLDYFELFGPEDERVPAARRRLANALF